MSGNQKTPVDKTAKATSEEMADVPPEDLPGDEQTVETSDDAPGEAETATYSTTDTPINDKELATLKAEVRKNMEGWQRTLAEFQNYKRRVEREQKELREKSALETIGKMLHIIDDFERALASVPDELEENPWMNGVKLIKDRFNKLLDEHDIVAIDPKGELFDPNQHQAVARGDSDEYSSDYVIETLQKGYQSGDTLLRPAMVRIAN